MKKGFGLFGLVITLAIIGLILWQSLKMLEKQVGDDGTGYSAPIDAAKQAKEMIESRSLGQ